MSNITSRKTVEYLINVAPEKKAETINGYLIYLFLKGEGKGKKSHWEFNGYRK